MAIGEAPVAPTGGKFDTAATRMPSLANATNRKAGESSSFCWLLSTNTITSTTAKLSFILANTLGYGSVFLDSGPFMTSAHKAYEACGFLDSEPYEETEVTPPYRAKWRFMTRKL